MANTQSRNDLLLRCVELYYKQGLKKRDVAKAISVSPTHVTRLLAEAREKGIVEIQVRVLGQHSRLENQLAEAFSLQHTSVANYSLDYEEQKRLLGEKCKEYFDMILRQGALVKVGIGGGGSVLAFVEAVDPRSRAIEIYPMALFGRGPEIRYSDSQFLAQYLLIKCRPEARGFIVGVPPLPQKREQAERFGEFLKNEIPEVKKVLEGAAAVDLAFIGLGALIDSQDIFREYAKLGLGYEEVQKRGGIGGINYNKFDANGKQIGTNTLTVGIEQLKSMSSDQTKSVVLVAGGQHKRRAIKVAIETGMVNTLVTDEDTANFLLDSVKK